MTFLRVLFRLARAGVNVAVSVFVIGFVWFVWQTQKLPDDNTTPTDAIVVLTGGQNRIEVGFQLLRSNVAKDLFISGVSKTLDSQRLSIAYGGNPDLKHRTYVGHQAQNTKENALETQNWLRSKRYSSIRLVTAGYHVPRSLLEFRRLMPELTIVLHPIVPENLKNQHLWSFGVMRLLFKEYMKFIIIVLNFGAERKL